MSYSISGTSIILTRGDTLIADVTINNSNGTPYEPEEGDKVRFAMKRDCEDKKCLINKEIPIETMQLVLNPQDTKNLEFGNYVYDLQITTANGAVCTFVTKAKLKLTEEVD